MVFNVGALHIKNSRSHVRFRQRGVQLMKRCLGFFLILQEGSGFAQDAKLGAVVQSERPPVAEAPRRAKSLPDVFGIHRLLAVVGGEKSNSGEKAPEAKNLKNSSELGGPMAQVVPEGAHEKAPKSTAVLVQPQPKSELSAPLSVQAPVDGADFLAQVSKVLASEISDLARAQGYELVDEASYYLKALVLMESFSLHVQREALSQLEVQAKNSKKLDGSAIQAKDFILAKIEEMRMALEKKS